MQNWSFLFLAIFCETVATSALKSSAGFSRLWPSLLVVIGYGASFYFLSQTLQTIPLGIAYAVWSGIGIALIALVGWFIYGQKLDTPALLGMGLIIAGVVIMNLSSSANGH